MEYSLQNLKKRDRLMKTKAIELYHELRQIDVSSFWIHGMEEKTIPKSIFHQSRFIGSEFDRSLKHIISNKNKSQGSYSMHLSFEVNQNTNEKIKFQAYKRKQNAPLEEFDTKDYLDSYDFQSHFKYGIENELEIDKCQQYLNELHLGINFDSLTSQKLCVGNLKIKGSQVLPGDLNGNFRRTYISVFPDLILDNRLLDIKSDIKINGRKPKYVAQILFYYFLIQLFNESNIEQNKGFELLEIRKIGFFYASYDKLVEIDVDNLLPNKEKLIQLVKNEIIYGNYLIREIIEKSLKNKALTSEELNALEKSIIERRAELHQTWDKRNVKRFEDQLKYHKFALDNNKKRFSVSKYAEYEKQMMLKIIETELSIEDAKLFVLEIDNEVQQIIFEAIDNLISETKPDKDKISSVLEKLRSDELRRLLVNRQLLKRKITDLVKGTKIVSDIHELKNQFKQLNNEIQSICEI